MSCWIDPLKTFCRNAPKLEYPAYSIERSWFLLDFCCEKI